MGKYTNDFDLTVSANIRRIRRIRHISQEKLAKALGITFQQVQKYEKGTTRVSAGRLVLIARALNCTLADLYAGCEVDGAEPLPVFSKSALSIAGKADLLPDARRDALLRVADALAA